MTEKLMQGDCLTLMSKLPDKSVDLIVSDPPYKVTARGNSGTSGGILKEKINKKGMVFAENNIEIESWLPELYRVLKDKGHAYIMTNNKNISNYLRVIEESNFHFVKCLIWVKDNKIMGQFYMGQFEYIIFLRKGKAKRINHCGTSDVINVPNKKEKGKDGKPLHPTEKPVKLMSILIKNSSNKGDVILDPFMGIGSTGVAAKQLKRNFIGMELDPKYFEIAKKRIDSAPITLF